MKGIPLALLAYFTVMVPTSAYATFPGQNGLIAFAAQANSNSPYEIYTVQVNGSGLRQITHTRPDSIRPDWSPDGRLIVFEIDYPDRCSVALMNSDRSNIVELTPKKTRL
jgi:Tol biopolymer transport system component